jgi:HemY protein
MELCRGKDMQDVREAAILRSARWLIDGRDAHACLARLAELPQGATRRTLALRLKLKAARMARETQLSLDTARLLTKHKAFSPQASASILRGLISDLLDNAHDLGQLDRAWKQLEDSERSDPDLALLAAQRFSRLALSDAGEEDLALDMARQCLKPVWQSYASLGSNHRRKLARAMEQAQVGLSRDWLLSIEHAQRSAGSDAYLQYITASACADQQLWGKAMQMFQQAAPALQDHALARRAWLAIAKLAQERADTPLERQALERAAQIID